MINIFETHSLIVRGFFFVCLVFFLNLIKFCKIIKPQKFKIKFKFVLHLTKKNFRGMRTKNISNAWVFRWLYICTTFKYLNVVLFQRVYKYITIRAIKFLWKLGLERWVWILEFSFFIEWKKVFEINSWTGYHLMNMSNITHDFLEIAARYSLRKRQEIDPTFPKFP